ncbi:unnamed protein product, partial [Schistosoma curassoni]|uniref:Leucine rich repeat containing 72 n=1 Tax=Schistosoma curassoni TaxID=6186 RepID=A0A183L7I1_9TREM
YFHLIQIKYLRQFRHLQSVCLHGNPISKNDDYKLYIHAMLPNLFYLDYQRTDDKLVSYFLKFFFYVHLFHLFQFLLRISDKRTELCLELKNRYSRLFHNTVLLSIKTQAKHFTNFD